METHDAIRENNLTPVSMLYELGFLGPEALLGHALYTAGHSQIAYPCGDDLRPDLGRLAPGPRPTS